MTGEIPRRFRGTPQDFLDRVYYLSHYKIADGMLQIKYRAIAESSAKIAVGERGWALAQRLPDGGCSVTVDLQGEDEIMWQTLYGYLVHQGWFEMPPDTASVQAQESGADKANLGRRTLVLFDGESAKQPDELFRLAFEVAHSIEMPEVSCFKGGADVPPEAISGTPIPTQITIQETRWRVNGECNVQKGMTTDEDFEVGFLTIQSMSGGGSQVRIEKLVEPKPTSRPVSAEVAGNIPEKVPSPSDSAATINIISAQEFDRADWFEQFTSFFVLRSDERIPVHEYYYATGRAKDLIGLAPYHNGHLDLSSLDNHLRDLAERERAIARGRKRFLKLDEEEATVFSGRCNDRQALVALVTALVDKHVPPQGDGWEPMLHDGQVRPPYRLRPLHSHFEICATVCGYYRMALGRLDILPADDSQYDFELVRYANHLPDWQGLDFKSVRRLFDVLAAQLRDKYPERPFQAAAEFLNQIVRPESPQHSHDGSAGVAADETREILGHSITYRGGITHFQAYMQRFRIQNGSIFESSSGDEIEIGDALALDERSRGWVENTFVPMVNGIRGEPKAYASIVACETQPDETKVEFIDGLYLYQPLSLATLYDSTTPGRQSGSSNLPVRKEQRAPIGTAFEELRERLSPRFRMTKPAWMLRT